jgi:hypothetical protein
MRIVSIEKDGSGNLQIHLEINSDTSVPFLEQEEALARLLNETGLHASEQLLSDHDSGAAPTTDKEGKKVYLKGVVKKNMRRFMVL